VLQAEKLLQPRECGDAFSSQDRTHQPATVKYVEARTDFEIP
jgi:hypothetical protein